jgi:antitoxin ParD1/3/4
MPDKNTSITLSQHWQDFVAAQVATGRYASASEVVREGLRLQEDRQRRIDRLNALIDEGLASDLIEDFDFDSYIAAIGDDDDDEQRKAA